MASSTSRHPLTVEDLWAMCRLGTPAAAPDGSFAVVPVTTYDMESNESGSRLYRVDAAGAAPRPLTAQGSKSSSPAISPDGNRLAFVRQDEKKRGQLAILPLDGGEAEVVTDMPFGISGPRWFPDGRRIAFAAEVYAEAPDPQASKKLAEEKEKNKVKAQVTENATARYWDHWLTEGKVTHLFVLDIATREVLDLMPESTRILDLDEVDGTFDISPDGSEVAFTADRSEAPHLKMRFNVWLVSAAGGEARNISADQGAHSMRPRFSPDGKCIVYGMQRMAEFYADRVRLVKFDRGSGTHTVLTETWDRSASGWEFEPAGDSLLLIAEDHACLVVYRAGLDVGVPSEIRRGGHFAGLAPMPGGTFLLRNDMSTPAELFHLSADGSRETAWTAFNGPILEKIAMGEVRSLSAKGSEGKDIQYWQVLPPDFDPARKWPLLLVVHGGPHGIWADSFHFRWNMQAFAAWGYVVVAPNFHGSTSFGQDFADSIHGGWGDKPYRDCMAVTDAVVAEGYVDDKRTAALGGSYGGYMMAWIAGQTDRFAALVNHAGVSDLMGEFACDVIEGWERDLGGAPWKGIEAIDAMNPVRFASGYRTPMLVIHGELDYRVPATQGLEIYNIYQAMGLPARLVWFPDENHWVLKPQNSRLWYREVEGWLKRWVG